MASMAGYAVAWSAGSAVASSSRRVAAQVFVAIDNPHAEPATRKAPRHYSHADAEPVPATSVAAVITAAASHCGGIAAVPSVRAADANTPWLGRAASRTQKCAHSASHLIQAAHSLEDICCSEQCRALLPWPALTRRNGNVTGPSQTGRRNARASATWRVSARLRNAILRSLPPHQPQRSERGRRTTSGRSNNNVACDVVAAVDG
jgi:hypothetical protein